MKWIKVEHYLFDIYRDFEPLLGSQKRTKQVFPQTRLESLVPLNEVHPDDDVKVYHVAKACWEVLNIRRSSIEVKTAWEILVVLNIDLVISYLIGLSSKSA